jgi:hypothetical protein
MIVSKFYRLRTIRGLEKANTKLIVHPDRILPCPVAFQSFQPVPRRCSQIAQRFGRVQIAQLSTGNLHKIGRKSLLRLAAEGCFRRGVFEGLII